MKLVKPPTTAKRPRRTVTAKINAKVAVAALGADNTMADLCAQFQFQVHANPMRMCVSSHLRHGEPG